MAPRGRSARCTATLTPQQFPLFDLDSPRIPSRFRWDVPDEHGDSSTRARCTAEMRSSAGGVSSFPRPVLLPPAAGEGTWELRPLAVVSLLMNRQSRAL